MGTEKYILKGKEPILEENLFTWGAWLETANRHVADDYINDVRVSTVFLGRDHNFAPTGPPILFETMIFGGKHDEYQERYSSWDEAEEGHWRAVMMVLKTGRAWKRKPKDGTTIYNLDGKYFAVCEKCRRLVRVDKPIIGSLHICTPQ
jgi:hypothetical protein